MKDGSPAGPSTRRKIFIAGLVLFTLVMVVTSFFGKKGVMEIARARRELRALRAEVAALDEAREEIRAEIRDLETDPAAVEREAREKLWLVKPTEKVVILKKTG